VILNRHRGVAVTGPSSGHRRCLVPCRSPFPASPSIIPDGGISPIRLEAKACLRGAFPSRPAAQAMARIRRVRSGLLLASSDRCSHGLPSTESRSLAPDRTAFAQGSFAPEALPSFRATTSPCADPRASHLPFAHLPYGRCPCRLRHPRLVAGTVPLWVCPSILKCHALYAGGSSSALDQFFPDDIGLRLLLPGSAYREFSRKTASRGPCISTRQAFSNVAALQVACPPGRSAPQQCSAPGRCTFELPVDSLPPRQSNMLPGRLVDCRGWSCTSKKGSRSRLHQ
jgi:hypothetical protein